VLQELNQETEQAVFGDDFAPTIRQHEQSDPSHHSYYDVCLTREYIKKMRELVARSDMRAAQGCYDYEKSFTRVAEAAANILNGLFWADINLQHELRLIDAVVAKNCVVWTKEEGVDNDAI